MAINKSRTPAWMKAVLIILALVFVMGFTTIGVVSCEDDSATTTDPLALLEQQYASQVKTLEDRVSIEPTNYPLIVALAQAHNQWFDGISQASLNTTAAGEAAWMHLNAAGSAYEKAIPVMKQIVTSQPASYTVWVSLAESYRDYGNVAANIEWMQSQSSTAAAEAAKANSALAVEAYEKALAIDPSDRTVTMDYAIALYNADDTAKAVKVATDVTKANADYAAAWYWLGNFQYQLGEFDDATKSLNKSLDLDPNGAVPGNDPVNARKLLDEIKAQ